MTSQRSSPAEPDSTASSNTSAQQLSADDLESGIAQSGNGEKQASNPAGSESAPVVPQGSAIKALGWLDKLLALWIFLAMAAGIILGNFVPNIGPALQKGKFVDVSIPIGMCVLPLPWSWALWVLTGFD